MGKVSILDASISILNRKREVLFGDPYSSFFERCIMKICSNCKNIKEFKEFQKDSRCKDGYLAWCKDCKNISKKRLRKDPKDKLKKIIDKTICRDCGVKNSENDPKYWKGRCCTCYKTYRKPIMERYRNTEYGKHVRHTWNRNMPEASIKKKRENDESKRHIYTQRSIEKRRVNPSAKIRHNISSSQLSYIKRSDKVSPKKSNKSEVLLGCTYKEFKIYLESKFTKFMTWEKFMSSRIHIDHIIPCSSFDLSKEENQKKCFHYTNLQPLWATTAIAIEEGEDPSYIGNINKGDRII